MSANIGLDHAALVAGSPWVTPEMMVRAARVILGYSRDVEEARMFLAALGVPEEAVAGVVR